MSRAEATAFLFLLFTVPLAFAANASNATAQAQPQESSTEIIAMVLIVIAIAAIAYTYRLTQTKDRLEEKIKNYKKIIDKQRTEIRENEETLARQREELSRKLDSRVKDEVSKTEKLAVSKKQGADSLRMEYWNRIAKLDTLTPQSTDVEKLENEKKEIEKIIALTKEKYHTRVIDEKTFSEIVGEYEKKLIEIESKLNELKG